MAGMGHFPARARTEDSVCAGNGQRGAGRAATWGERSRPARLCCAGDEECPIFDRTRQQAPAQPGKPASPQPPAASQPIPGAPHYVSEDAYLFRIVERRQKVDLHLLSGEVFEAGVITVVSKFSLVDELGDRTLFIPKHAVPWVETSRSLTA
jgi:sRNA-binding regulator protein Hfq